jgi:hypothetical protein
MVHPIPFYEREYRVPMLDMLATKTTYIDVRYMIGDFLFAFMLLRFYFLVRTLMNLNLYSELTSKRICGKYQIQPGVSFSMKALIKERPGITVFLTALISILWLAYLLRIFERIAYESQGQKVFDSYFSSVWNVIITMTTVGYGDIAAISDYGRVISILNALWGAFIISLLVASIGRIFELNDGQARAIQEIKEKEKKKKNRVKDESEPQPLPPAKDSDEDEEDATDNESVTNSQQRRFEAEEEEIIKEIESELVSPAAVVIRKEEGQMGSLGEIQELKEQVRLLNEKVDMLLTLLTPK